MPRHTTTIDLHEEQQRLDDRLDELADEAANADEGSAEYDAAVQEAGRVEQKLVGIEWALEPDSGDDVEAFETVTLGALTTREFGRVADATRDVREQKVGFAEGGRNVTGPHRVFHCAAGLVDAPFLDDGADFQTKADAVGGLAPQFAAWLEDAIDDLSTPDVELGNGFSARLDQARTETSTGTSSSNSRE